MFVCVGFLFAFGCFLLDLIGDLSDVLCRRLADPRLRQGPVRGVFPKITLRGSRVDFVNCSSDLFSRCMNFRYFRCLWPDWPYSRLKRPVIDVQATDETMT